MHTLPTSITRKTFFIFFSLSVFIVALIALWAAYMPSTSSHPSEVSVESPDSYMEGITFYQFDKRGKLRQKITSNHGTHYEKNNRLVYNNPNILVYSESGGDWKIQADEGEARDGSHFIKLLNHVVIHRKEGKTNPELTAKTSELIALPQKNIVQTDMPVTIQQPHLQITGVGLIGNLLTGELKTLGQTMTVYTPKA